MSRPTVADLRRQLEAKDKEIERLRLERDYFKGERQWYLDKTHAGVMNVVGVVERMEMVIEKLHAAAGYLRVEVPALNNWIAAARSPRSDLPAGDGDDPTSQG